MWTPYSCIMSDLFQFSLVTMTSKIARTIAIAHEWQRRKPNYFAFFVGIIQRKSCFAWDHIEIYSLIFTLTRIIERTKAREKCMRNAYDRTLTTSTQITRRTNEREKKTWNCEHKNKKSINSLPGDTVFSKIVTNWVIFDRFSVRLLPNRL